MLSQHWKEARTFGLMLYAVLHHTPTDLDWHTVHTQVLQVTSLTHSKRTRFLLFPWQIWLISSSSKSIWITMADTRYVPLLADIAN